MWLFKGKRKRGLYFAQKKKTSYAKTKLCNTCTKEDSPFPKKKKKKKKKNISIFEHQHVSVESSSLLHIIVFICDLFVSRDDPLMS